MEYFARVFKVNPYHDAHGRFTSKEKVGHYGKIVHQGLQGLALLSSPSKSQLDQVAEAYVKQGLHYAAATGGNNMPGTIEHSANLHGVSPEVTKKLKGVIAAKKAWTSQYKNKAIAELQSDEMAQMAAESILNYSDKANAKYNQKTDALQTQFYANGGSKHDWEKAAEVLQGKLLEKLANPEKTLATAQNPPAPTPAKPAASPPPPPVDLGSTLTPKTAPTGFGALPPKPHDWHTWGPGKKAAWTKKNNQLAAMSAYAPQPTPTPVSSATVLTPKPAPAFDSSKLTTKWSEPDSINDAKKLNAEIGTAYYMKRQTLGKDHPEVQALYSEWEKSKQYLQNYGGLSKNDIGSLSSQQKSDAEKHMASIAQAYEGQKKILQEALNLHHANILGGGSTTTSQNAVTVAHEAAKKLGLSDVEFDTLQANATDYALSAKAKHKAELPGKIEAAAYAQAHAKLGGLPHDQAKKSLELLKAEGAQAGLSHEDIQSLLSKGAAKAVVDSEKQAQLSKQLGSLGSVVDYFNTNFKPFDAKHISSDTSYSDSPEDKKYRDYAKAQAAKLSTDERNALDSFLGSGYSAMNKGSTSTNTVLKKEALEKGLDKITIGYDMNLRRNMAQRWFWESFGVPMDQFKNGKVPQSTIDSLIGKVYKEKNVVSTTKTLTNADIALSNTAQDSGVMSLMIRAHKNIKGIDSTAAVYHSTHENEVTLASNTHFLIHSIKPRPGGGYIAEVDALVNGVGA